LIFKILNFRNPGFSKVIFEKYFPCKTHPVDNYLSAQDHKMLSSYQFSSKKVVQSPVIKFLKLHFADLFDSESYLFSQGGSSDLPRK
jgi:hypothetical protein